MLHRTIRYIHEVYGSEVTVVVKRYVFCYNKW